MSLKEIFHRKFLDYALCPAKVITPEGEDAHAKNDFIKIINRPEFTTPLLTAASALAIHMVISESSLDDINFALRNIGGALAFNGIIWGMEKRKELERKITGEVEIASPKYYLDRREKHEGSISPAVEADLLLRQEGAKSFLKKSFAASAIFALINPAILLPASVFAVRGTAYYWQNKRAIEGEWKIHETLPKQEKKTPTAPPIPAYIKN